MVNNRCEEHLSNIPRIAGSILLQYYYVRPASSRQSCKDREVKKKVCAGGKSLRIEPHPFLYVEYVVRSFQ